MRTRVIISCVATLLIVGGCLNVRNRRFDQRKDIKSVQAEVSRERPVLNDKKIDEFFFETYWDSQISDEILTGITLQGEHVYAYTQSNRLYQIDMQSGRVNWLFDVGAPLDTPDAENPIAVYVYDPKERKSLGRYDEVFIVARDQLFAIDLDSGSELWRVRLPFSTSCPPVASLTHVYVGSWDDRIYAINKEDQSIDWFYRTNDDISARPAAQANSVYVSSEDGQAYRIDGVKGKVIWPFKARRKLTADPFLNEKANLLYLPSDDYSLYVVGTLDGRLEWKHETGGRITRQPVSVGVNVYAFNEVESFEETEIKKTPMIHAYERQGRIFNKTQHKVLWSRKGATQYLADGLSDCYVLEPSLNNKAKIVKLDKKKGFFRDALEVEGVDFYCKNTLRTGVQKTKFKSGIIFLGYRNGWIVALKERPRRN
ncbi:MAG: PQQ-binding-like beta-propeller repeat protein [Planctomycetota bacterium]|nr:PQQ-binding-like beta-propeller repeat protein [Planctomycetota bacterium]